MSGAYLAIKVPRSAIYLICGAEILSYNRVVRLHEKALAPLHHLIDETTASTMLVSGLQRPVLRPCDQVA